MIMKQRHLNLMLSFSFLIQIVSSAQDSLVTEVYHERLYHLCKVWGYAKYTHPEVATCKVDWDQELLESVSKVSDQDLDFNQFLLDLLDEAGQIPNKTSPKPVFEKEETYNLNLEWFDSPIFDSKVTEKLGILRDNYRATIQCKIKGFNGVGNPDLGNDNYLYSEESYFPSEPQRILALFRYWNIINYFFPYKYQMDQDWDLTLKQFIPSIVGAQNELDFVLAFKEMTTYINDSHAFFNNQKYYEWLGSNITPFFVKYIENQTVIVKVHESVKGEIEVGDIITHIDGQPIEVIRNDIRKYTEGSNEPTINRNINNTLIRGTGGRFNLTINNENGEKSVELIRRRGNEYATLYGNSGTSFEIKTTNDGCDVGYIDMELLTRAEVPKMFESFGDLPAIIVDIRNYPQGTLWEMVDYLYDSPINFAAFTVPQSRFPGVLKFQQHSIGKGGVPYKGKLILLFNEDTQSQAEFTIMGLEKHPRALKIGSQTAGADGNISRIYLPGGIQSIFTGLGVFYPDGRETQRIGIVPDIEFHPTVEGVRAGRDEMLDFALDCQLLELVRPEFAEGNGIEVFPNPVKERLNIRSEYSSNYTIQVTDILGRFIRGFSVSGFSPSYDLDLTIFEDGIYLLSFRDENGVFATEKIIKL